MFSRVVLISRGLDGFRRYAVFRDQIPWHSGPTIEYTPLRKGDDGGGDTPLPIPNREVKPARADGTAGSPRGRVGRRPFFVLFGFRFETRALVRTM